MDVLMPQLGETVAEGKVTKWFKSAGDAVKPGHHLAEAGIDLVHVSPSGPHGRIVAKDVAAAAAQTPKTMPATAAAAPLAQGSSADQVKALYRDVPFEEVPLDSMRKTIATRLMQAKQ